MIMKSTIDKVSLSHRIKTMQKGYLAACNIPAILFLFIRLLYTFSPASCFSGFLSWKILPFLVLSSGCMYYFLKHSSQICVQGLYPSLLFTTAYSFCSYGIEQETSLSALLLYAIFPIIFYSFENMLEKCLYLPFLLSCTIMLYIQPETGIQTALLLLVLALLILIREHRFTFGNILHIIAVFLFSFGLGAARVLFYLAPYISNHRDYNYSGFSYSYHPALFVGRFFPGVTASRLLSGTSNRMDIYCGILPFLCFLAFFMLKEISLRKKVFSGVFTIILLMMLEFSPMYYIFNLFHITYHSTLKISFLLIFWMLYLGMQSFQALMQTITTRTFYTFFAFLCLWGVSFLWGKHNFFLPFLLLSPIAGVLYCILFSLIEKKRQFSLVLLILCICELGMNGYICTNRDYFNTNSSLKASFAFSSKKDSSSEKKRAAENLPKSITDKQYESFISKHTPSDICDTLQYISSQVELSNNDKKKYCKTLFPDSFQTLNAKCKKSGISGTLFTQCSYSIHFSPSQQYNITDEGNHIYNIASKNSSVPNEGYTGFTVSLKSKTSDQIFQIDNMSGNFILLDQNMKSGKSQIYVPFQTTKNSSTNFQILLYKMDDKVYGKLEKYVDRDSSINNSSNTSYLLFDYVGIGITFISVLIFAILFLYDKCQDIYKVLYKIKERSNHIKLLYIINTTIKKYYIFVLSFLIPFSLFIITMLVGDALPFGANSVFDSDGAVSTIPAFLDQYYKYQNDNQYLSMNIGFGSDLTLSYSIYLLAKLYHFLPLKVVIPVLEFMLALCLGLCGLNMTIYMTCRKRHTAVCIQDFRLLLPSAVYALNAYILASRNYPTWYLVLMLFPLVMLAMDNLMEKKQILGYSLLLGICILTEIQLAMFICIYLVIHFFTFQFHGFKDFICKGLRFGFASLLGGGAGFIVVYRTLTAYQSSGYSTTDGTFPSPGFHGSFWSQWYKLMIFTPTDAASLNPGNISLYCGIFTLILVSVYFLYKKTSLANKLRYLIPILILSVSYNGQVLSYLWNGLHYQSNCPNRYVFLLIFLLAELSYEGIILLPGISLRRLQPIILCCFTFFILCKVFHSEATDYSLLWTLAAIMVYGFLHHKVRASSLSAKRFYCLFIAVALLELSSNTIYTANTWNYTAIQQYGEYTEAKDIYQNLSSDTGYSRSVFLAMRIFNQGQYYNTGCINSFGTCLNLGQLMLSQEYGFNATTNSIYSEYSSTPLHTSLSSCRYLLLPIVTEHPICDLTNYKYLGIWQDTYYVYENPNYCALGFYYPAKKQLDPTSLSTYPNDLAKAYLGDDSSVCHYGVISYNTDPSAENSFYFTDSADHQISPEKGISLLDNLSVSDLRSSQVKMHINYTASKDDYYYLSAYGLTSLGRLHPGKNSFTINLPNELVLNDKEYNLLQYDNEKVENVLDAIRKNQLTNIQISNDTITGTSNYPKDGYTIYSLGYSKNWHAYVDGKEVETLNPYDTNLLIPTPAGKHTITLKFIPKYLQECQIVTLFFWSIILLSAAGQTIKKKRKK